MDPQQAAGLDSYFTYGFRVFAVVTVITTIVCTIVWLNVEKKIRRYNENHPGHEAPVKFISSAVRFAFFIIGLLIVMGQVKPLAPVMDMMLSAGSVLAICSTFAAKKSFSNYISGFLISVHRPYIAGDRISIRDESVTGTVEEITFRHTTIKTDQGTIVTIPNAIMNSTAIENLTEAERRRQ